MSESSPHPLSASKVNESINDAFLRSVQNPYQIIFNECDRCIYLNGSRFTSNYNAEDVRNMSSVTLSPNVYYIISGGTTVTLDPVSGIINEFIFETIGSILFTNTILWAGNNEPPSTGIIRYSILYNDTTNTYVGSWAAFGPGSGYTEKYLYGIYTWDGVADSALIYSPGVMHFSSTEGTSSNPVNIQPNMVYIWDNPISELYIDTITNSPLESTLYFKTPSTLASAFVLDIPQGISSVSNFDFVADTTYVMSISSGVVVMESLNPINNQQEFINSMVVSNEYGPDNVTTTRIVDIVPPAGGVVTIDYSPNTIYKCTSDITELIINDILPHTLEMEVFFSSSSDTPIDITFNAGTYQIDNNIITTKLMKSAGSLDPYMVANGSFRLSIKDGIITIVRLLQNNQNNE